MTIHPANLLDVGHWTVIEAFRAAQGGMGGAGPLPFAGGWLEQPAGLAEAFRHLAWCDSQIRNLGGRRRGSA